MKTTEDMEKDNLYKDLSAYFSGELNKQEKKELEAKLSTKQEWQNQFNLVQNVWNNTTYPEKERKLKVVQKTFRKIRHSGVKHKVHRFRYYAAAVVAAIFIAIGAIWTFNNTNIETQLVHTSSGEIKQVVLEDGTKVWLNAESTLSYPQPFSKKNRIVKLEGEAYFDVRSNKKRPFKVETDKIIINVTGTQFNVSSYKNDPLVSTFLEEGSVSVNHIESNSNYDIKPGYVFELNKGNKNVSFREVDMRYLTAWKNGELSFYNESFESISRKLERKFGVEIILKNENIKNLKYTADFDSEGIDEILDFLDGARTMEITAIGNKYYISERSTEHKTN